MYVRGRVVYRAPMTSRPPLTGLRMRTLLMVLGVQLVVEEGGSELHSVPWPFSPPWLHLQWLYPAPTSGRLWLRWPSKSTRMRSWKGGRSNSSSCVMNSSLLMLQGGAQSMRRPGRSAPTRQQRLYRPPPCQQS